MKTKMSLVIPFLLVLVVVAPNRSYSKPFNPVDFEQIINKMKKAICIYQAKSRKATCALLENSVTCHERLRKDLSSCFDANKDSKLSCEEQSAMAGDLCAMEGNQPLVCHIVAEYVEISCEIMNLQSESAMQRAEQSRQFRGR